MTTTAETTMTDVLGALVELMRTGTDPDVLEAQKILLRRIALEGDVTNSRIPAPRNITEVGGYLNLLSGLQQPEMQAQLLAGALGVSGPNPALGWEVEGPVISFISLTNDRPTGPNQNAIPTHVTIRSDMMEAFVAARKKLHDLGCLLPLLNQIYALPKAMPGLLPPLDLLPLLGRTLSVVPALVLNDPDSDPLAMARLDSDPTGSFGLVARELGGGSLVAAQQWIALKADAMTSAPDAGASRRYQPLAPIMAEAGWYPVQPPVLPINATKQGNLTGLVNVTGLIKGQTRLGDELSLLYTSGKVAQSSLAGRLAWVWDGLTFVAPA